jgi:hypothetical protein
MARSKPYVLGEGSFVTDDNTVQRTPQIPIPSSETSAASAQGYLNQDGSINYTNVYGKGNYEFLGAPDSFKQELVSNPNYWNTINQSIGGSITNVSFNDQTGQLSSSVNELNTDANQGSTVGQFPNLRYPLRNDGGFDFLKITCYEYVPGALDQSGSLTSVTEANERIRKTKSLGSVALPMQPGISESNSVGWGEDRLNALQIAGAKIAGDAIRSLGSLQPGQAAEQTIQNLKNALGEAASSFRNEDIIAYFAGQAVGANIFRRGTGRVLNPNLELLFSGPNLRTFNYTYRFTPRESSESNEIKQIIKFFKKNMAPKKNNPGIFLQSPNVFKLKYIYANGNTHPFLNNIKMCALTGFTVDYTPDGSYMTYKDGSMTSYQISMQFNELDPIYSNDYEEGEGSQGMGY